MRAEARSIAAVLSARGNDLFDDAAEEVQQDMARVVAHETPEPRIVTIRHPETRQKMDAVLDDPDFG